MKKLLLASLSFLAMCGSSNATTITITASGKVDFVSQTALDSLKGLEMTAVAVYNTVGTDSNPDSRIGIYNDSLESFTVTLGGQLLTGIQSDLVKSLQISNDYSNGLYNFGDNISAVGYDQTLVPAITFPGLGPWISATAVLTIRDTLGLLWNDDSIPGLFDSSKENLKFLSVNFSPETNSFNTRVDATITSIDMKSSAPPIPEPATMLLFGTGIASLAAVSRKKTS